MIQFKGVCFMWFKVTMFHPECHTLLIQSLQQGMFCVFNNFLAVVLLVSCGQTLVSHSQPLFTVDCVVHRKKGLAMRDQPDLSSAQNVIVFSMS